MRLKHCLFIVLFITSHTVFAQGSKYRQAFATKLNSAGIGMTVPPNFWVIHPVQNPAVPYDFGLRSMHTNFEVWFRVVNTSKIPAGDSVTIRNVRKQVALISTDKKYVAKNIPPEIMKEFFNADFGRSFALSLKRGHQTRNYKYALLMTVQKTKTSSLTMLFLSDENGPSFYRNVNSIFYTVKFK